MKIAILGRQNNLSLAELEARFGADAIKPLGDHSALLDADLTDVKSLGGTIKLAESVATLPGTDLSKVFNQLIRTDALFDNHKPGKLPIGVSVYGIEASPKNLWRHMLKLKEELSKKGVKPRIVANQQPDLNAAQVRYNQLLTKGIEIILVSDGKQIYIGRTLDVQDPDAYGARDYERPKRDPRVGMLPPKLAQIIINLSGAKALETLWDPFCGTGVLLQEALLMEIDVYGSDIDRRMINYSKENLEWLKQKWDQSNGGPLSMWYRLMIADATKVQLKVEHKTPLSHIASEIYLGRPFSKLPEPDVLEENAQSVSVIVKDFLKNVARQTDAGFRMCVAVPVWKTKKGFKHLPALDHLEKLGYTRVVFKHVDSSELIYARDDQVVGRQLLVLQRS